MTRGAVKISLVGLLGVCVAISVLAPRVANAACSNPAGAEGDMTYNTTHHMMQFCDDTDWIAMAGTSGGGGGGCTAPTGCTTVGDTCADGSKFAGFVIYGASCELLFVTDVDQSTGAAWGPTGVSTGATDYVDGKVNQSWIVANTTLSNYPSFELCENLNRHSKTDWYLPSAEETFALYRNRTAIGNITTYLNSSTQFDGAPTGYNYYFDGQLRGDWKTDARYVRCVRREASSGSGGGSGLSGPSGCANIGDLCADGTVFAGYHPITRAHLFIPTTDQEQPGSPGTYTMNWKNATGTDDISTDSDNDGQVNHANRGGAIGDFQAYQACEDLSFGGQIDWYLPSRVEIFYLWSVRGEIEAGGNITNFQNSNYWPSTEYNNTTHAWNQNFNGGGQTPNIKTAAGRVRCIRR